MPRPVQSVTISALGPALRGAIRMSRPDRIASVSDYYDRNTARFLRIGGRADSGSLHRAVWGPGVRSRRQALAYVDDLVADVLAERVVALAAMPHVVDLGCGVGGTAVRLASTWDLRVTGLTVSGVQAERARARAARHGVAGRCRFLRRDLGSQHDLAPVHMACAVESLSHVGDITRVLAALARCMPPGGCLVVCDDFETPAAPGDPEPAGRARWLARFRHGWRLEGLTTVGDLAALAARHGLALVEDRDLTPFLRFHGELVLHLLHTLGTLPLRSSLLDGFAGGAAGQRCLERGWTQYRFLVLRREDAA